MSSPQLTPDQARVIFSSVLPSLKNEHQTTKRVIEAIPLDKGNYRPDAVSKTALELAWHIVASEKRFLSGIPVGVFDFSPIPRPESASNSAGIAAWFDESFAANLSKLETLSGEQLGPDDRFPGHVPASRSIIYPSCTEPHHPPSWATLHVPAAHGRESPLHLRRELRHHPSPAGEGRQSELEREPPNNL